MVNLIGIGAGCWFISGLQRHPCQEPSTEALSVLPRLSLWLSCLSSGDHFFLFFVILVLLPLTWSIGSAAYSTLDTFYPSLFFFLPWILQGSRVNPMLKRHQSLSWLKQFLSLANFLDVPKYIRRFSAQIRNILSHLCFFSHTTVEWEWHRIQALKNIYRLLIGHFILFWFSMNPEFFTVSMIFFFFVIFLQIIDF